jgi:transcriptional regulator with XRE-family HTH domain
VNGRCVRCGRQDQLRRGLCHADYEKDRRAGAIVTGLVDATTAKARIAELLEAGWGTRRIATAAGIDRGLVSWIMRGRAKINAKTRDAILAIEVPEPDHVAIAHRGLVEAGQRGDYVSPQREYRHARRERLRQGVESARKLRWVAKELGVSAEELTAERQKERRLPFPEAYEELRYHVGLSDWHRARHLGISNESLLRQLCRYGIKPRPEFVSACVEERS